MRTTEKIISGSSILVIVSTFSVMLGVSLTNRHTFLFSIFLLIFGIVVFRHSAVYIKRGMSGFIYVSMLGKRQIDSHKIALVSGREIFWTFVGFRIVDDDGKNFYLISRKANALLACSKFRQELADSDVKYAGIFCG